MNQNGPLRRWVPGTLFVALASATFLAGCTSSTADGAVTEGASSASPPSTPVPRCTQGALVRCDFPGSYPLDAAISLAVDNVRQSEETRSHKEGTYEGAHAACVEVAYPGAEPNLLASTKERGTFLCLFNNAAVMNMALNRISTFVEDFETVDDRADYTNEGWSKDQLVEGTKGHNLESPDLQRYMDTTRAAIGRRAASNDVGIRIENEFLEGYIRPNVAPQRGRAHSILLGVPLPANASSAEDAKAQLQAVLGHEIFHAIYFHSEKMRSLVQSYLASATPEDVALMRRRLSQKGYDVVPPQGAAPSAKQEYMFQNETAAYLLETGACDDGAFISYKDADADDPKEPMPKVAPLVVRHGAPLRQLLLTQGVLAPDWAARFSPDLVARGCRAD